MDALTELRIEYPKTLFDMFFLNVNDYTNVGEEFCTNTQLQ